ncbi:DUF2804 domain-containing protein [Arthrobacter yangruifuii]|uniref:DUF2804 domain-containing protein n=1 Tax=Arthrobacter yangruifuii TaxID=2606616 RepID=UPI0011B6CF1D|nr:DUF2804 domain-containing protein [Arthrobacter yangruifuii]
MDEITSPVDLGSTAGLLNPAAVGYARSALHRPVVPSGLRGGWRTKRWEYWGIMTPDLVLGMTIAHLDYASTLQLYVLERGTGKETAAEPLKLLPTYADVSVSDELPPLTAFGSFGGSTLRFHDADGGTRLSASSSRISADLFAEADGDVLGVVVPWSANRYQYTLKDVARRVSGTVAVDGREYKIGGEESFAVLDRGRGRWPYSRRWNWGVGSGTVDGTRLGLQFGGKWTAGTPATENALIVDGHLHHYDGELEFAYDLADPASPWRVTGPWIDATLTPFHRRVAATNAVVIRAQTWQAFGTWTGTARTPNGTEYPLDGLTGWVEEARNRW